jgi:hypothetical protein
LLQAMDARSLVNHRFPGQRAFANVGLMEVQRVTCQRAFVNFAFAVEDSQ